MFIIKHNTLALLYPSLYLPAMHHHLKDITLITTIIIPEYNYYYRILWKDFEEVMNGC